MDNYKSREPVFIDLETYQDSRHGYSLSGMSDVQYILDPRFHLMSVGIGVRGKVRIFPGSSDDWQVELRKYCGTEHLVVAHNGRFDFRVLKLRYGIQATLLGDTMLMARYLGHPQCKLGILAPRILGEEKLENSFDGLRLSDLTEDQWNELAKYNAFDVNLSRKLFNRFISEFPDIELLLIDHTLRLCLKENQIDNRRLNELLAKQRESLRGTMNSDQELFDNLRKPAKIRSILMERTNCDPGTIDKKKTRQQKLPKETLEILESVWGAKESEKAVLDLESIRERLVNPITGAALIDLNYSKAVTHRWSGGNEDSQSYNVQNMSKSSGVREIWIPDPGHWYSIVDFAQIEVRMIAWFAGETTLLEQFVAGKCVYCEFGLPVFGYVLKPSKDNSDGKLRQVSKQGVIGLSYGMGHTKFHEKLIESCRADLEIAFRSQGFNDGLAFAKHAVDQYRNTFRKIAALPKIVYKAYQDVVSGKFGWGPIKVGLHSISILYAPTEAVLSVKLPTGSTIFYREIKAELVPSRFNNGTDEMQISYQSPSGRKIISYSTPIENLVQAMARDIMGQKIAAAENSGFDIRTHSHDEVVTQIPKWDCLIHHSRLTHIFETPLNGFQDLPLSCKGFVSDRYTKDDVYVQSFTDALTRENDARSNQL